MHIDSTIFMYVHFRDDYYHVVLFLVNGVIFI